MKKSNSQQGISQDVKTSEAVFHREGATHQAHNLKKRQQPLSADNNIQKLKEEIDFRKIQLESNNPNDFIDKCLLKAKLLGRIEQKKEDIEMFEKFIKNLRKRIKFEGITLNEDINKIIIDFMIKLKEVET